MKAIGFVYCATCGIVVRGYGPRGWRAGEQLATWFHKGKDMRRCPGLLQAGHRFDARRQRGETVMHRYEYIDRAIKDFARAREQALAFTPSAPSAELNHVAGMLLLAARIEQLEDTLTSALQTAGEGI